MAYSGRSSLYLDTRCFVLPCLAACSGWNLLKGAVMLHADFCMWKTSGPPPPLCERSFPFLFKSKRASVEQVETFHRAVSTGPGQFLNWRLVPKTLFSSFDNEKQTTPSVFFFFLLFPESLAASAFLQRLFAFSGQCPAVKAPYQLMSMFPVTFTFLRIDWAADSLTSHDQSRCSIAALWLKSNALKKTALQ